MPKTYEQVEKERNHFRDMWHEQVKAAEQLQAEVDRLNKAFEPMEAEARKALEMNAMPILLNGGSGGAKRLSQLIVEWHEAEQRTATRCAEIAEKHGCSQCMGIGSRCCADAIREEFKGEE